MVAALVPGGPKGKLITGVMPEFNRDSLAFMERCAREFGDVVRTRFLYLSAYFLFHPDHVEQVLVTNNRNFIKPRPFRAPFLQRLIGKGLLTSDGEFWRRQRRLAQPAFHRDRTSAYGETMVAYTERMLASWRDGETLDAHEELMRLTQDIVVRTLFNADVSAEQNEIVESLGVLARPFESQATLRWIADNRLPTAGHRRFHRAAARLDKILYRIIAERRASGEDRGDLLSMLLAARDEDGTRMTDRQLRDEVMTLFLAGHETTALALTWAWHLLAWNAEAETKLHAELETVLGGRTPTAGDMPRLPYCEWVVKESLRLYPPAYVVGREAVGDFEIGGYRVPAGAQVFMPTYVIQRDPRFYDEPSEFRPERWREETASRLPRYAYFPFGGGPRLCIGQAFAMMEAVLILATIAQKFRLRPAPGHRVEIRPALSLRPRDGVRVLLEKRAERHQSV
ncbi:MAG: cytochrome P450 [Acidobacteria bacterium]|nr:cytochrome P450 [Acidobacteriota bacterium]